MSSPWLDYFSIDLQLRLSLCFERGETIAWEWMRPSAINCPPALRAAAGERRGPHVLVDDDTGDAAVARVHGRREMGDILLGEELGQLGFERRKRPEVVEV